MKTPVQFKLITSRLALFILPIAVFSVGTVAAAETQTLKVYSNPAPKVKVDAQYPALAARRKNQGWIIADLDVAADGSVSKVHLKNSFGGEQFIQPGIDAMSQWQYKPKGNPAEQFITNAKLNFQKGGKRKLTNTFSRKYNKISNFINTNELSQAKEYLEELPLAKLNNMQELNMTLSLWANYAQKLGDKALHLAYLDKMNLDVKKGDANYVFSILKQKLILQMSFNHLIGVKRTFNDIKKLKPAKPYLPAFEKAVNNVDLLAHSNKDFSVPGRILNGEQWRHEIARKKFSVTDIKGKLTNATLRCSNKVKELPISKLEAVSIKNNWSHCYLDILGENNASFKVIEHPKA